MQIKPAIKKKKKLQYSSFYSGHRPSGPNKYCTSLSAIEKPIFYHLYNSKQQGLLSVSLLADLNSHAVSHCPYSLSLTDESSLKMNSVHHIPQTLASHSLALRVNHRTEIHTADMLKPDPRDTFYKSEYNLQCIWILR